VTLRLYGPLNDFLPRESRQRDVVRDAPLPCSVKDLLDRAASRIRNRAHPDRRRPVGFEAPVPPGPHRRLSTFVRLDASALPALRPPCRRRPRSSSTDISARSPVGSAWPGSTALYENHADD